MRGLSLFSVAAVAFLISGCVKHSVVIKVNPDGSAVVHVRHFEEDTPIGSRTEDEKLNGPTESQLKKLAARMGMGVSVRSVEQKRDANGWQGYEILFDVKDINKLVLKADSLAGLMQIQESDKEEGRSPARDSGPFAGASLTEIRFGHANGILTVEPRFLAKHAQKDAETIDPFAGPASAGSFGNKLGLAMAQPFLGAARAGLFIQVEPEIKRTNARFVDGKLIALMRINFGKLLSQKNAEENIALLDELVAASGNAKKAQAVSDSIKGLDVDMTPKITVQTQ